MTTRLVVAGREEGDRFLWSSAKCISSGSAVCSGSSVFRMDQSFNAAELMDPVM